MSASGKIHFIGIGGIGMSGIAKILLRSGYAVTGSDLKANQETEQLREMGATVFVGHDAKHIGNADAVVYSSAIPHENPEYAEALRRRLPVLARAEMLAELMRKKQSIVVAGAHGKTTTSALIAAIFEEAGFDPTAVIGGRLKSMSSNARLGSDEWFVCESDESDGSFLKLLPYVAVITNIDTEHLNHYGSFERLKEAFLDFSNRVPFDGMVIVCRDDPHCMEVAERTRRRFMTYGLDPDADVNGENLRPGGRGTLLTVCRRGELLGDLEIPLFGKHNALNALAATAVGLHVGLKFEKIRSGLARFPGIDRRLETRGSAGGVDVIDDYAHHPTEIRASLDALELRKGKGSLRVLFQPHRYSRVRDLWDAFVKAFDGVKEVCLAPVYPAAETALPGIQSDRLAAAIVERGKAAARAFPSLDEAARAVAAKAEPGDVIVTMGAGDVTRAAPLILSLLGGKKSEAKR